MGTQYLLSVKDFARFEGITPRSVKRRIGKNLIRAIKVKSENGHGKNGEENRIHYSNLSSDSAREAFLRDRGLSLGETIPAPVPSLLNLTPNQKTTADRREKIVREYLQVSEDVPPQTKTSFKKRFAKSKGIGYRTLDSWIGLYKEGGYSALVPDWNSGTRAKKINREISRIIQRDYLQEFGPPKIKVFEDLTKFHGFTGSYRSVVRHINAEWTKGQQMLVRDPEAWNRKFAPFVRRDWTKVEVNEVWFADGKQLDIACLYRGKPIFPWVSYWMDARSRRFVGWIVTPTHNSLSIGQAFLYGVKRYGPPKTAYTDRGKAEKSRLIAGEKIKNGPLIKPFEGIEDTLIPGILRDLGTELFLAAPRNPREKIIEPNFGIHTDRHKQIAGYRGHNTKTRPWKLNQEIKSKSLLSLEEISERVVDRLIEERNARPHSTTGKTPNSFYENFIPQVPSQAVLDYLLMDARRVKVKDSTIAIEGLVYRGEELWRLAGEEVEARRDPKDITSAVIIHKGKVFETAILETPDHYRGPITLETRNTCTRIRRKQREFAAKVMASENIIDDPLRMEVEMEQEAKPRKRETRPPAESNVRTLHKRERLAREVSKARKQPVLNLEDEQKKRAVAGGGKDFLTRYAATLPPMPGAPEFEVPRYLGKLSYNETFEDD